MKDTEIREHNDTYSKASTETNQMEMYLKLQETASLDVVFMFIYYVLNW